MLGSRFGITGFGDDMSMLPRRGKCTLCGHDWDRVEEGWRTAGNIAGFAGREMRDLQKRLAQFQFCIDRVAEALGNVCCGGVDSSPEDQMADPHSTTRVLVDAVAKQRGLLLWALYHHQGGSSAIGQPIRQLFGMFEDDPLTAQQIMEGKVAAGFVERAVEDGDWKSRPDGGPA